MKSLLLPTLVCTCLLSGACQHEQPPVSETSLPQTQEEVIEPSFEEQLALVRAGDVKTVTTKQPVSNKQFLALGEGCEQLQILKCDVRKVETSTLTATLQKLPALMHVVLSGTTGNTILQEAASMKQLRFLNLPEASFDDAGLQQLADHPTLELLRFQSEHVTNAGMKHIAKLPQLRFLHLIKVPITDAGLKSLYGLENLESFYIDGGDVTEDGPSELIKKMPGLHFHWNQLHLDGDPHGHTHE